MSHPRQPSLFIPHGGGPCFFMDWQPADTWTRMQAFLEGIAGTLPERPKAVVVISGHWEEDAFTVNAASAPPLLFDYYGFPEHTYRLTYPAPGAPDLAERVVSLLSAAGLPTATDHTNRGLDHGVFIPFKLIFPDADVPVVQLSLLRGLDPATHIKAGEALAALRDEGVLIVGSGMSYHNLRAFGPNGREPSRLFDAWLTDAVEQPTAAARDAALDAWSSAPAARIAHPREEHLIPLMVAAGAAGTDRGNKVYADDVNGLAISAFRFG
ncbi:class III extradiol ring-cleavage dioxygenase [Uliginosibacterium sp. sgz301328]|uniref:DODA-type extradiol aromatic ring-opening family dioxygenase n=1 Tax=Uliginosibacterium sp. sgz301328 TaxID=3243764 RepID=UPI00359DDA6D